MTLPTQEREELHHTLQAGVPDPPLRRLAAAVLESAAQAVRRKKSTADQVRDAVDFLVYGCRDAQDPHLWHALAEQDWLADLRPEELQAQIQGADVAVRHLRQAARLYASNVEAGQALGIAAGSFGRMCRRHRIMTPQARQRQARRQAKHQGDTP